ncbi:Nodulin-like [Dillenia turbinata]|uniref:Nodulin-like n=1 Tax=Dillenia turbinata TaxID=194707 RepID=A0AAN8V6Y9_9MAGN
MIGFKEKFGSFYKNRWLVFVAAMWIQSCAGVGYLFGSISPVIKSALGYNQRQVAFLGVAKDLGDSIGFIAGSLCEILPLWGILLIGSIQNLVGYGLVWLVVADKIPTLPLWVMCVAIFVGTNGETYFNTVSLVSCVQNFPRSRGPVVGILKGFAGLSGAILTQVYTIINAPSDAALIFMIAVGPTLVVIALMFIVRPVGGHRQIRPSDGSSFLFIYSICIVLAAYLLGIILLEDLLDLSEAITMLLTIILFILLLLPITIPILLTIYPEPRTTVEVSLLREPEKEEATPSGQSTPEVILSEVEDEKPEEVDTLPRSERHKRIAQLQTKLFQAAAVGAVRVKRKKGPRRGEDFTLLQALVKADFLLIFLSLVLAAGSGLTIIDNMGQISESLGYSDSDLFVSIISIWNFLGRVAGGYFSEIIVKRYAYPRPVSMVVVQVFMALALFYYAMAGPGEIYVVTVLIGLGYGAHWAIVPAAVSELFGLKSFGALYNFLTLALPIGTLIFSGVIASGIYDYYAELQSGLQQKFVPKIRLWTNDDTLSCSGSICYSITCGILSGLCFVAVGLSLISVYRTKSVYAQLYGTSRP